MRRPLETGFFRFCTLGRIVGGLLFGVLGACADGSHNGAGTLPSVPTIRLRTESLPAPFDERTTQAVRAILPIGAAQLATFPHIDPQVNSSSIIRRGPQNTGDQDGGGQSGYIINPGSAAGDGSIYVAMTAYDDAWVTTPTDGSYNTVNAPTTHGPNGNCIETVTNYYNGFGTPGTTVDQVQFYDFCANNGQGAFVGALPMDAAFVRDYVRTYADPVRPLPRYISAVVHSASDNRWHAYLYNATRMQYDDYYDSAAGANTNALNAEGWSIFETHYNGGDCTTLPDVSEEAIEVRTSAGWHVLSGNSVYSYSWGTCFSPPLSAPYYAPVFSTTPSVAWTITSPVSAPLSEYARVIRADAPLAYYRLGDYISSAHDSSGIGGGLTGVYGANVSRNVASNLAVESRNSAARTPGGTSIPANFITVRPAQLLQPARTVSVETWLNIDHPNVTGTTDIVSYGSESAGQAYTVQLLPNDTIAAYITTPTGYGFVTGKTILAAKKSYLVDATYDGSQLCVYVDGALDGTTRVTGPLNYAKIGTNGLGIGSAFSSNRQAFSGTLDEVAVFGAALTSGQIGAHWTAGSGVSVASATSEYAAVVGADSPLAFYRLTDAAGVAIDAGPNHMSAAYGSGVVRNVAGLLSTEATNNSALFPGGPSTPAVAVTTARNVALEPARQVSIETWLQTATSPSGTVDVVSYGPELLGQPYTLQLLSNRTVEMFVTTAHGYGLVQSRTSVSPNTPHLIDATYDGTTMRIYIDGTLDASQPATGTLNYTKESAPYGLSLGTAFNTQRAAFAGELDDVAIYGTALTASQVTAHWTTGSGHVAVPSNTLRSTL